MVKVTVHRASIYPFNGLTLMPGENNVSDADAKMLKGQKGVMRDVERGLLSFDEQTKTPRKSRVENTVTESEA